MCERETFSNLYNFECLSKSAHQTFACVLSHQFESTATTGRTHKLVHIVIENLVNLLRSCYTISCALILSPQLNRQPQVALINSGIFRAVLLTYHGPTRICWRRCWPFYRRADRHRDLPAPFAGHKSRPTTARQSYLSNNRQYSGRSFDCGCWSVLCVCVCVCGWSSDYALFHTRLNNWSVSSFQHAVNMGTKFKRGYRLMLLGTLHYWPILSHEVEVSAWITVDIVIHCVYDYCFVVFIQ